MNIKFKDIEDYVNEEIYCPHCKTRLSCCQTPAFHVGDGLGWGSEYMYICLNDKCSLFVNGWDFIEAQFGRSSSYRYMQLPGESKGTPMMVGSRVAFKDSEIDLEAINKQNTRYNKEKKATQELDGCLAKNDLSPVLTLLLDEAADIASRRRACELLPQIKDLSCLDPLRNHCFRDEDLQSRVNLALSQILAAHYLRECPKCMELVKTKAVVCKHCGCGTKD